MKNQRYNDHSSLISKNIDEDINQFEILSSRRDIRYLLDNNDILFFEDNFIDNIYFEEDNFISMRYKDKEIKRYNLFLKKEDKKYYHKKDRKRLKNIYFNDKKEMISNFIYDIKIHNIEKIDSQESKEILKEILDKRFKDREIFERYDILKDKNNNLYLIKFQSIYQSNSKKDFFFIILSKIENQSEDQIKEDIKNSNQKNRSDFNKIRMINDKFFKLSFHESSNIRYYLHDNINLI